MSVNSNLNYCFLVNLCYNNDVIESFIKGHI